MSVECWRTCIPQRILHGAVYPKHVLVEASAPHRVWLIDFEKARRVVSATRAAASDLDRLLRHAPFLTTADIGHAIVGVRRPRIRAICAARLDRAQSYR